MPHLSLEIMRRARKATRSQAPFREGDLTRLELRIAKRADKLWRSAGYCRGRDLIHWLQAEREVLKGIFLPDRPADAGMAADR